MQLKAGCLPRGRSLRFTREPECAGIRASGSNELFRALPLRFHGSADLREVICDIGNERPLPMEFSKMGDALQPIFRVAVLNGGLPFHAALIEKNGTGVLIGARGRTGKSTCARRIPPPWRALADDEALIVRTGPGRYSVHPLPTWSEYVRGRTGRTWNVSESVPLRGVFFLEQCDHDQASPRSQGESAMKLHYLACEVFSAGFGGPPTASSRTFQLSSFDSSSHIARSVPCFTLKATRTGRFWEEIERVLSL